MLVLARKVRGKILIDHGIITISVVNVAGSSVRIGIEAPLSVRILRSELKAVPVGSPVGNGVLVLTRKVGECITIGDSITLTVVSIDGGTVRLGIEAPRVVKILRGELAA